MTPSEAENFIYGYANIGDTLDQAYRRAAKRLHPDSGGDAGKFQRLQETYELLNGGAS